MVIPNVAKKRVFDELIRVSGGDVNLVTRQHILDAISHEGGHISIRTVYAWLQPFKVNLDGNFSFNDTNHSCSNKCLKRNRNPSIEVEHLDVLLSQLMLTPNLSLPMQANFLFEELGVAYEEKQISRALIKNGYTRRKLYLMAKDRDEEFRMQFRDMLKPKRLGGNFSPHQFLFIDESIKRYMDVYNNIGYGPRGEKTAHQLFPGELISESISVVASFSVEGTQSVTPFDTSNDETIDAESFLSVLECEILPMTNRFPGHQSVLIFDNARTHNKFGIYALCHAFGVLVLFLPPYSPDFNPIEKSFNQGRNIMHKTYGNQPSGRHLFAMFDDSLRMITPDHACNFFEACFIEIPDQLRQWATRCDDYVYEENDSGVCH